MDATCFRNDILKAKKIRKNNVPKFRCVYPAWTEIKITIIAFPIVWALTCIQQCLFRKKKFSVISCLSFSFQTHQQLIKFRQRKLWPWQCLQISSKLADIVTIWFLRFTLVIVSTETIYQTAHCGQPPFDVADDNQAHCSHWQKSH